MKGKEGILFKGMKILQFSLYPFRSFKNVSFDFKGYLKITNDPHSKHQQVEFK